MTVEHYQIITKHQSTNISCANGIIVDAEPILRGWIGRKLIDLRRYYRRLNGTVRKMK